MTSYHDLSAATQSVLRDQLGWLTSGRPVLHDPITEFSPQAARPAIEAAHDAAVTELLAAGWLTSRAYAYHGDTAHYRFSEDGLAALAAEGMLESDA